MISLNAKNIDGVWFGVAHDGEQIFATMFANSEKKTLQGLLGSIPFDVSFQCLETASAFANSVLASLKNVYNGKNVSNSFSLATEHLSQYTRRVIEAVSLIPVGYVAFYGSVAEAVGGSPRAVGRVMALNPFAPLIPCHRVVGSDFTLVGYGGCLDVKLQFLNREKRGYADQKEISVNGKKLRVFPVEFVLEHLRKNKGKKA